MDFQQRKNNRLENYDYSQDGTYFLTLCTKDRKMLLSRIVGGGILDAPHVELTLVGRIVDETIKSLFEIHGDMGLDNYVIMPNHVHLLVSIAGTYGTSGKPSPTNAVIPKMISSIKRFADRQCGTQLFQRSYYDHIIRDEEDYLARWKYIDDNPTKWEEDELYY